MRTGLTRPNYQEVAYIHKSPGPQSWWTDRWNSGKLPGLSVREKVEARSRMEGRTMDDGVAGQLV